MSYEDIELLNERINRVYANMRELPQWHEILELIGELENRIAELETEIEILKRQLILSGFSTNKKE